MTYCKTCELISRRDANNAPLWDCIYRTQHWDIVHNYQTSLPGWLVLVVRRHIGSIDELTHEESIELGVLLRQVSLALKEITGCVKTYVIQFAELAEHQYVHFHVIPRMANQPENRRSTNVFGYSGVSEEERVSEEMMNEIATKAQKILISSLSRIDEKASFKQKYE
jgi:diadenosine tetraphosphate (Ap4A) HIT family hydrolase